MTATASVPHVGAAGDGRRGMAGGAGTVAQRLGAQVGWWITFNEPTFIPLGYLKIWGQRNYMMPPGLGGALR